ncbi:ATP-dependent DNA helicase RecG [Spirochaetota bacterium]|nr:ATP-dependent DNA helicase RecG [Spirochaetota bacterium]
MLSDPVEKLFQLRPHTRTALARKEIRNVTDLIYYFPRRYEDRTSLETLQNAIHTEKIHHKDFAPTIIAQCTKKSEFLFRNRRVKKYTFIDNNEHSFNVTAYNPWQRFRVNEYYILSGKIREYRNEIHMNVTEYESFDEESITSIHLGRIVGIYAGTENLTQKQLRTMIEHVLTQLSPNTVSYTLPAALVREKKFAPKLENIREMHFPTSTARLNQAHYALVYEELYVLEEKLAKLRKKNISGKEPNRYPNQNALTKLTAEMDFTLTHEQSKVLKEIVGDMASEKIMQRLVQGEVGSGKTLLAALSMYYAHSNGYQSALMAPTEVLVQQHMKFFEKFFAKYSIPIAMLAAPQNAPKEIREKATYIIRHHPNAMILGTHALIQKKVVFPNLKYVIIDEQHRFGVDQRQAIMEKGDRADFLSLSATPIPRSLYLTLYGDLVSSKLRERPKKAMTIHTKVIPESERAHAYKFLKYRVTRKQEQAYVVFPVIEESSSSRLRSLNKEFETLKKQVFTDIEIAFIHGKMKASEKDGLMEKFYNGTIRVLFATTVLEVGIDHPNATVIIIESAHQFGLSQLHQLRGRVGRHLKEGYCYLVAGSDMNVETYGRLEQFANVKDGFKIAELDLKIRGPGELIGLKQSGLPPLKIADLVKDEEILIAARKAAYAHTFNDEVENDEAEYSS